jgi:hypothetical protein
MQQGSSGRVLPRWDVVGREREGLQVSAGTRQHSEVVRSREVAARDAAWVVLGIAAGCAIVWGLGVMHGASEPLAGTTTLTPSSSLGAATMCYLVAAATGRRWSAWVALPAAANLPFLGLVTPGPWWAVVVIVAAVVAASGRVWRRREAMAQTVAMLAFFGAGVVALYLPASAGLAVAGTALLGHAAWNGKYYRSDSVVNRSFAAWCGALDVTVGVATLIVAAGLY